VRQEVIAQSMNARRPTRDSMSLEEATISHMWEMVAIVELPGQKGLCTKQDLQTIYLSTSYAVRIPIRVFQRQPSLSRM
jgi:hypothetical protein